MEDSLRQIQESWKQANQEFEESGMKYISRFMHVSYYIILLNLKIPIGHGVAVNTKHRPTTLKTY